MKTQLKKKKNTIRSKKIKTKGKDFQEKPNLILISRQVKR